MPRVKSNVAARRRHKRFLKQAKGYWGGRNSLYRTAREAVQKSLSYAFRDRKVKKRDFRRLWIARINAATRIHNLSYSMFINGLNKAKVVLNRKVLADRAVNDPKAFEKLTKLAKNSLESGK